MGSEIWVVAEHRGGQLRRPTLEALGAARQLATAAGAAVAAVVLGKNAGGLAAELGTHGAARVLWVDEENLDVYSSGGYTHALTELARAHKPLAIVFAASSQARDFAPRLAARLDTGLLPDCIELGWDAASGRVSAKRFINSGKALATVQVKTSPALVTTRPKAFAPAGADGAGAETVKCDLKVDAAQCYGKVKEYEQPAATKVELTEADVVVSGGRGMKGPAEFAVLEELAQVLGAAIGASRAAVDAGWREHAAQVGQTGKVVTPKLYIACGISGAIQHLVGMTNSKIIVAINKDADAPLMKLADYAVVGDLFQLVPALTQEFKRVLEK
ncbi:MAG: electron transfer flavoprotein subunit alpha/FixB family protein [Candidatus Wallbacteria bacterium]|nr:electron transfer flavoprotein subunit alpha/FixB family protein [Candidatus Wallbacteria bacterium]